MDVQTLLPSFQPPSFAERGIALSLTTPMLLGARGRMDQRGRLELIVPNPSGRRGVYVLPAETWEEMCQPTLHDVQLHARLTQDGARNPRMVRAAARSVAVQGAAGRQARAAALQALQTDAVSLHATRRHLLERLAQEGDVAADPQEISDLAAMLDPSGLGREAKRAVLPVRLARLRGLCQGLADWAAAHADEAGRLAAAVQSLAQVVSRCADLLLGEVRDGSLCERLAALRRDPIALGEALLRPEWVLDGWDLPCSLWAEADGQASQRAAVAEIAAAAPMLPPEAGQWAPGIARADDGAPLRRQAASGQHPSLRMSPSALVARNERLLALAL